MVVPHTDSPEVELGGLDIPELGTLGYQADVEFYKGPMPKPAAAR